LISAQLAAYNSADPTVHVSYCHLLSFVIPPSGVNYIKIFSSKTTRQFQPKFAWIILKYVSTGTLKVQNVCHTFHLNGTTVQISAQLVEIFGFISSVDVYYLYIVQAAMLDDWWDYQIYTVLLKYR
jgi:hypothetical protein